MNAELIANIDHATAYETLRSFIRSLDAMWIHKRINGKFASASDVATLDSLAALLWRIYSKKRDSLLAAGMSWDDSLDYAAAFTLSQYHYAQTA